MILLIGKKKPRPSKLGFTLVEVLLVVIILLVVAGLTIPNFGPTYLQFQLKESASNLSYYMRYVQSRAVHEGFDHRIEFDSEYSKYWITRRDSKSASETGPFSRITGRLGRVVDIPEKIKVESPEQTINFYKNGRIDKVRIYMCHKDKCLTVSTQEQSGYVEIYDFKLET